MKSFKNTSPVGTLMGFLFIAGVALAYVFDHAQSASGNATVAVDATQEQVRPANATAQGAVTAVKPTGSANPSTSATKTGTGLVASTPSSSNAYKNGTYTTTASYRTPENTEQIAVTLGIANDTVTDVSVQNSGFARESQRYQSAFSSGIRQYVVGKSISSLRLSRVSGASLTTSGFNQALASIKAQAAS